MFHQVKNGVEGRRDIVRVLRGIGAAMVCAAALTQLTACSTKAQAPSEPLSRTEGSMNRPEILSGSPERDAAADTKSEEMLTDADWQVLERLGPRPIWEKLEAEHRPHPRRRPATQPAVAPAPPAVATTQPGIATTQPAYPTTRPTLVIDETDLPVQTVELPDGKLRVIWALRNMGGTTVTSSRDPVSARRTVALAAPDLAPIVAVLTQALGAAGGVTALPRENTLVITCDRAMKPSVLDLLRKLDIPARQVEITAKIFEVNHDFDFQQGTEFMLSHLAADNGQALTSTFSARRFLDALQSPTGAPVQGSVLHLMHAFDMAGVKVDVSFQLLQEAGLIQVVSSPRMTVAAGQTGYMLAGQEVPIQTSNIVNNVIQVGTTYKPVGVQLYITPETVGKHKVKLHTISIVSAISGFSPIPTMDGSRTPTLNPVIDSREAETAVTVDEGNTLVISGMRMTRTTTRQHSIPGLGDVPALGWLFKNHRTQQEHTDLYFFITPAML